MNKLTPLFLAMAALPGFAHVPATSLATPLTRDVAPGADGFIKRWLLLEPIPANGLTDSLVRTAVRDGGK